MRRRSSGSPKRHWLLTIFQDSRMFRSSQPMEAMPVQSLDPSFGRSWEVVGEVQPPLCTLARRAERNLVYDPFGHNAVSAKVLAAGAACSIVFSTNGPTTDLTDRSGLVFAKRALLSVVPDHFPNGRLENLPIGLARGKHLHRHYGNVQQLNSRHG